MPGFLSTLNWKLLNGKCLTTSETKKMLQLYMQSKKSGRPYVQQVLYAILMCQCINAVFSLSSPAIICPSHSLSLSMARVLFAQLLKFNNGNGYTILHLKI